MQLSVYVPKDKASVVKALDEAARRSGRPKNDLVIEAIERFLETKHLPELKTYNLGVWEVPPRAQLYDEWGR